MILNKKIDRRKSIGQVADELKVKTHVIRFWESKFDQIKPEIGAGNRRYYYSKDVKILKKIKNFLYEEGYTIAGLQNLLKQRKKEQRAIKKEDNLQLLLQQTQGTQEVEETQETKEENSAIDNFITQSDKEAISKSVEQIELNLSNLQKLFKAN